MRKLTRIIHALCWGGLNIAACLNLGAAPLDVCYLFEDDAHEAIDSSKNGINILLSGETRSVGEGGKFGSGRLVIGKNPVNARCGWYAPLNRPEFEGFRDEIRAMSIVAWIKPTEAKYAAVILRRIAANGGFDFTCSKSLIFSVVSDGIGSQKTSPTLPPAVPDEWMHVAVTFNEGEVTFYQNGEAYPGVELGVSKIPAIGDDEKGVLAGFLDAPVDTSVDDFAFFGDRALTPEEISKIYADGLEAFYSNDSAAK